MAELRCPTCGHEYDGDQVYCDADFALLVPAGTAPAEPVAPPSAPAPPAAAGAPPVPGTCACGAPLSPGTECEWCGAPVEPWIEPGIEAGVEPPDPPGVVPQAEPAGGGDAGTLRGPWGSVEVGDDPLEIGRGSPEPAIAAALADLDIVSRQHAEIIRHDGAVWLRDVASSNGTFVNDRRLEPHRPVLVRPGDAIRLGSSVHLELGAHP